MEADLKLGVLLVLVMSELLNTVYRNVFAI